MSWPTVKLGELEGARGNFVDGPFGSNLKASEYVDAGVPIIQLKNIKPNKYLPINVKFVSEEKARGLARHSYQAGDVVIAKLGAVGTACIIPQECADGIVVADVVRFRGDRSRIDYQYLCYFLNSPQGQSQVQSMSRGATRTRTNLRELKKLEIPLPPLETQKQIAAILEKADQLRKDCQQMEQELKNLAQSVFMDMFGDPGENPKGWARRKLSEFYIDEKAGTKCGPFGSALKKEDYTEEGVPVWNMDNITLSGKFEGKPSLWVSRSKYKQLESYSVLPGDVIISRAGTVGKMGVVKSSYSESLISTNLIRVRFGENLLPRFFVCLMLYCKTRLKRLKVGDDGSFSHMNTGILDELDFPYPPLEVQREYVEYLEKIDSELVNLKTLSEELNQQFNGLSIRAFNGDLAINNKAA